LQDEAGDDFFFPRGGEVVFGGPIALVAASGGGFRILWLAIGGDGFVQRDIGIYSHLNAGMFGNVESDCRS
jgi:hypothetical protein